MGTENVENTDYCSSNEGSQAKPNPNREPDSQDPAETHYCSIKQKNIPQKRKENQIKKALT